MNALNAFTIAIPTIAVLFGILLNRQDATAIRSEMRSEIGQLRNEMKAEIGQLRNEMIQLRNSVHSDMVSLHERLAVVEAKQNN
jgi:hypothetical protein